MAIDTRLGCLLSYEAMKRIFLIILWALGFYFIFSLIGGTIIGIIMGFTDFDVEKDAKKLVGIADIFMLAGILLGLILGIKEKLPGTQKDEPAKS